MTKNITLMLFTVLALLLPHAAGAQFLPPGGPPFGFPREEPEYPRRPPPGYYEERRRPVYRDDEQYERRPLSNVCVTSRGECYTRRSPYGAPCRCEIPGFGLKRGNIGG